MGHTHIQSNSRDPQSIRDAFSILRHQRGRGQRDIATLLRISEAQLLSAHCNTDHRVVIPTNNLQTVRLRPEWPTLLEDMESLGEVLAVTQNSACIHETVGFYRYADCHQSLVKYLDKGHYNTIELRIFYRHWRLGFAVIETLADKVHHSLQFFDAQGCTVHTIHLRSTSQRSAYGDIVRQYADHKHRNDFKLPPAIVGPPTPHNDLHRMQVLRRANPAYAQATDAQAFERLLHLAMTNRMPIRVRVGNKGVIQTYTGILANMCKDGLWLNASASDFKLNLHQDQIDSAWIVRKPTTHGVVSSMELFDRGGTRVAKVGSALIPGKTIEFNQTG